MNEVLYENSLGSACALCLCYAKFHFVFLSSAIFVFDFSSTIQLLRDRDATWL